MAVNIIEEVPTEGPMDSSITDMFMNMIGRGGAANAAGGPAAPVNVNGDPNIPPTLTPALPPTPMSNAAPDAPMPRARPMGAPPPIQPPMTTGSANAAPMAPPQPSAPPPQAASPPLTMQDLTRRGALQQYLPDVINAFLPTPEAPPASGRGSANAHPGNSNAPYTRPPTAPTAPMPAPRTGSANAAPLAASGAGGGGGSAPSSASWGDIIKSIVTGGGSTARAALEAAAARRSAASAGSANAAGSGGGETTGDELAARRQQAKVGPPQLESLPKGASSRYTRPYAKGGVKEGQKRPMPKQKQQAPRASAARSQPQSSSRGAPSQKRAGAAPQTARGGRSAYAQSLIDSMGPRGAGVTTYIEPSTGNEILTGNGIYQNLGKTSTGTQKPSYTKFFDR